MQIDWVLGLELTTTAVISALLGVLVLVFFQPRGSKENETIFADRAGETSFLFDGEFLVDATPGARALLSLNQLKGSPWSRLLTYLGPRFPGVENDIARLPSEGCITLTSAAEGEASMMLRAEYRGGLTRIVLLDAEEQSTRPNDDALTHRAIRDELQMLRRILTLAPMPIWREDQAGDVIWANATYLMRATHHLEPGQELSWPLPRLFERANGEQGAPTAVGRRQRLSNPDGGGDDWFELAANDDGNDRLVFGLPANALVQAEGALRDFTQTLTKTFAHLPIGLAIFDRQRQLALFNPALLDLCNLPPDFLAVRPTLFAFLDAMRDRNMIPEPKDYRNWRKQMTELERAAASGHFEETWSLPSGQTYRVIGRPHPNGALALMFEDISTEISRIRRYRADLELGQSVIDALDQALAVFSPAGILVLSNARYAALWGHDPAGTVAEASLPALCAHWRDQSAPTSFWADVETFMATDGEREPVMGEVRLLDGRLLNCRFAPLSSGAAIATFQLSVTAGQAAFSSARALKQA